MFRRYGRDVGKEDALEERFISTDFLAPQVARARVQ